MSKDLGIDEAIEQYRQELVAEASLAKGDLDEIEDHLRALIDELRADQPALGLATAIAQARERLGEPRALAREKTGRVFKKLAKL